MDKNKRIRRIAKRITKNDILNPYPIQFTFHAEYLYQDYWIYDLDGDIEYKILIMDTDSKKLKGDAGYSLRVGTYRVLYDIDDKAKVVTIYRIKHRREAYR